MKISELDVISRLKPIENKIKSNPRKLSREDIQNAVNIIIWKTESFDELKDTLKKLVKRAGIKILGMKTLYTPREDLEETDKTYEFLSDLWTYRNVRERYGK